MTSFKFCFGLLIVSTMGLGTARPIQAEVVTNGYLVIDGKEIKPPFDVRIVGDSVTVNGLQVYPYIMTPVEIQEEREQKNAQALLDSVHEEFIRRKKSRGRPAAAEWLRSELRKSKFKSFAVKDDGEGVDVDLMGSFDINDLRHRRNMQEYNTPTRSHEKFEKSERWHQHCEERARSSADVERTFLDCLEENLKGDPEVVDFKMNREGQSYHFRWKDEKWGENVYVGGNPDDKNLSTAEIERRGHDQEMEYQARRIVEPLSYGWCLVAFGGSIHQYTLGKPACDSVLRILRQNLSKKDASLILPKRFHVGKKFWRDIERYNEMTNRRTAVEVGSQRQ